MNNLVAVILSVAFLAVSIPMVFSAGQSCATSNQCLTNSSNTECCLQHYPSGDKTCEVVDNAALLATYDDLHKYNGTQSSENDLQPYVDAVNNGQTLQPNASFCIVYNRAQLLVAQGGNPATIF